MKNYTVVIVGGGPAGAAASKRLADKGVDHCVIEKYSYPRKKLCAGGLTRKGANIIKTLGLDIDGVAKYASSDILVVSKSKSKAITLDCPVIMVDRTQFDEYMIKRSTNENLFEGETATDLDPDNNKLTTNKDEYGFEYIIFSDGANGLSNKFVKNRKFGFSAECDSDTAFGKTVLDFTVVKDGYGWIFPKDGHSTVGLARLSGSKDDYASLLLKFASKYGLDVKRADIRGFRIPEFSETIFNNSVIGKKIIMTGDAASLVDNVSGEGIYYALLSGMNAADSICEALENGADLHETYCKRSEQMVSSLKKRQKLSKMLYSPVKNAIIKKGLSSDENIEKLKRLFG